MSRWRMSAIPLMLAALLATPAGADPLKAMQADQLCFARSYDAAHLARTPAQKTTAALASLTRTKDTGAWWLRLQLSLRDAPQPPRIVASCEWTSPAKGLAGFPKAEGYGCIAIYSQESAEEAGTVVFDAGADAASLTVYVDGDIGFWGEGGEAKAKRAALGKDDIVFRLDRVEASRCADLNRALVYE